MKAQRRNLSRLWLGVALLALLVGSGLPGAAASAPQAASAAAPAAAPTAPSIWYVRGDFNGWGTTDPMYDDGTHGDLVPGDGIFAAEVTIATAGRYEWKVGLADWSVSYPTTANSWCVTTAANQVLRFTFDSNTYADGWLPAVNIVDVDDAVATWTAVGDWQGWDNANLATVMSHVGYGRYYLAYQVPTAGSHEYKAVVTGTWDALGADNRSLNADNLAFSTTTADEWVYFLADTATGRIDIHVPGTPPASPWYVRGDFNGWGTTDPMYDDGTHGDLMADDGVFSAQVTIATAGRYEWKAGLADWSVSYPAQNSWIYTTAGNQVVRFTLDTNTAARNGLPLDGWLPAANVVNADDDVGTSFTAVGDFNAWNNADPATLMAPVGFGRYFLAHAIPTPGTYLGKVTRTATWDAFGADGRSMDAQNIEFVTTSPGETVYFLLDVSSGRLQIVTLGGPGPDNNVWWDGLEHDSRDSFYRLPFGAVTTGTPITLRFRTYADDVTGVQVRVWDTHQEAQTLYPMARVATIPGDPYDYDIWSLELAAPNYLTILYYRFIVTDGTDTDYYEDDDLFDGGLGMPYDDSPDYSWQIDVYDPAFTTPDWFRDAIVYQIFPDRFRNGIGANDPISGTFFYEEDPGVLTAPQWNWIVPDPRVSGPWEGSYSKLFYGGDLQGIVDKLDYLQALGVNTLYLNPIFESPSNHKYDTTNYEVVDDNFGDLATFQALVAALDARGMHLVLDGVFNHTSSDSHYFDRYGRYPGFVGACEDVSSPYRDWYYFYPASPPGSGVCAGDTTYNAWWGFDSLPKLNTTDEPDVRTYIYSDTVAIATYWLNQGADGWRLDVAGDVDHSFWQDWRPYILAANPNAITIAEEWGDASHFVLGDELDSSMNYRFRNAVIGLLRETDWSDTNSTIPALAVSEFDSVMHGIEEDYPPQVWYTLMNLVDSHDTNRILIPLDQDGDPTDADYSDGKARLRVLALIQMTMPGAPTVYYGDEVGLVGYGEPAGGGVYYSDPYNRQPYPWDDEPGYAGLPEWRKADATLYAYYATLAAARNDHPALRAGSFDTLLTDDDDQLYAYGRKDLSSADAAVVIANRDSAAHAVVVDVAGYLGEGVTLEDVLDPGTLYTVSGGQISVPGVGPMSGALLLVTGGDITPPSAPANLVAIEGSGVVTLTWDVVADADTYNVYRSYVMGGGYDLLSAGEVGTTYVDSAVTDGTWYYYVVTAVDAVGNESDPSNEAAALPHASIGWAGDLEPPSIVHTIGITPTEPISAQVWIDGLTGPGGPAEGVLAELGYGLTGTLTSTWSLWVPMDYADYNGNNDVYTATLTPEMTGTFQYLARFSTTQGREWTYAFTPLGRRGTLTVQQAGDTTPPATPQNLVLSDWSASWVELTWDPVTGDPGLYAYDVYRSDVSGTVGDRVGRVLAPTTMYTDTAVTTGQTYYYVVQAVDHRFNRSGYSNEVEATPQAKLVHVTFEVTVPDYTPDTATVYIVGDIDEFCNWCDPQTVALDQVDDVTWTRSFSLPDGLAIQYKYTRGNWDVNEWWGPIVSVNNRHMTVDYGPGGTQLMADNIPYWRDPLVMSHYPADGAVDVEPSVVLTVTLSRFLDPSTITADNLVLASSTTTPPLDIAWVHHTEMTATTIILTPLAPLAQGTLYTMTLKTGLEGTSADNGGIALQFPYAWTFSTSGSAQMRCYLPIITR